MNGPSHPLTSGFSAIGRKWRSCFASGVPSGLSDLRTILAQVAGMARIAVGCGGVAVPPNPSSLLVGWLDGKKENGVPEAIRPLPTILGARPGSDGLTGTPPRPGCSPGRITPRKPHRPITNLRAPENLYESGMSRPGNAGRTPDRIINHDAPCLGGAANRPWDAASRDLPGLNAPGENRGRMPKAISDVQRPARGSRTRRYRTRGEGVREKVRNLSGYHPLQPHGGQALPCCGMFGICKVVLGTP